MTRTGKVELKRVMDPDLASALSHPMRGHILVTIGEMGDVSPKEIASETGIPVAEISYHFRRLRRDRLIKEVRSVRRRGFAEHFYRLTGPVLYIEDPDWESIPEQIRASLSGELMRRVLAELMDALRAHTLSDPRSHLSHFGMLADDQAQREILEVEEEALRRKLAIKDRCDLRAGKGNGERVPLSILSAAFRRAP